jgi:hypothetical protein
MSSLRSRTKATAKAKPSRSWAVTLIKNRGVLLGFVEAPDQKASELAAAKAFTLSEWQRKRLLVRERIPETGKCVRPRLRQSICRNGCS